MFFTTAFLFSVATIFGNLLLQKSGIFFLTAAAFKSAILGLFTSLAFFIYLRFYPVLYPLLSPDRGNLPDIHGEEKIRIPFPTPLQTFFNVLLVLSGSGLVAGAIGWLGRVRVLPDWVMTDLSLIFFSTLILRLLTRSEFEFFPRERRMTYRSSQVVFFREKHVSFDEIAALVTRADTVGWPLLFHLYKSFFVVDLVFRDGKSITWCYLSAGGRNLLQVFEDRSRLLAPVAKMLECPFVTGHFLKGERFSDWKANVESLLADAKDREALEMTLWQAQMTSLSFDAIKPGVIKLDLPTISEKAVLGVLTVFFVLSTYFLIVQEWELLLQNPRIFYLLILDTGSVLATLLGLWTWLIDEYYILDLNEGKLKFHSRILFYTREWEVMPIDAIEDIRIFFRHDFFAEDSKEYGVAIVGTGVDGKETSVLVSDFSWLRGIAELKAHGLKKILGFDLPRPGKP